MTPHIDDIILIGPIGAGKSTIGKLLAARLGIANISMDDVRWNYYQEIGYSKAREDELRASGGFEAVYWYWKPFELHAVERILSDHRNCVIDFGAGHSVFEDDALFARARAALALYRHVILLLPSADLDESARVLRQRQAIAPGPTIDFVDHFVRHPCNHALATLKIYTEGRTPEETCDDILHRTNRTS